MAKFLSHNIRNIRESRVAKKYFIGRVAKLPIRLTLRWEERGKKMYKSFANPSNSRGTIAIISKIPSIHLSRVLLNYF